MVFKSQNDKRKQLTWQEAARAIEEIHKLKQEAQGTKWTASDTARTLGVSLGKVSEDLLLAGALSNERVARRPSRRGAIETVKKERELELVRELARRRATSIGVATSITNTAFTSGIVYNDNCVEILKQMEEASVDLIFTDPPWGIDFDKSSQWSRKWIATYDDTQKGVREMLQQIFPLLFKVLKPSCHMFCFFPVQEGQWWVELATSSGFVVRQRPLVWFKTGQPSISEIYTSFLPCYESFLWMFKPGSNDSRRLFSRPIPEGMGADRQPESP